MQYEDSKKLGRSRMQREVDSILAKLIAQLIPEENKDKDLDQICKITKLSKSTLRMAHMRKSISADTLIKLLLVNGVSKDLLLNLPRNKPIKFSPSSTLWNKIGLSLGEKERGKLGEIVKTISSEWKLRN